jgi:hypothetical protein
MFVTYLVTSAGIIGACPAAENRTRANFAAPRLFVAAAAVTPAGFVLAPAPSPTRRRTPNRRRNPPSTNAHAGNAGSDSLRGGVRQHSAATTAGRNATGNTLNPSTRCEWPLRRPRLSLAPSAAQSFYSQGAEADSVASARCNVRGEHRSAPRTTVTAPNAWEPATNQSTPARCSTGTAGSANCASNPSSARQKPPILSALPSTTSFQWLLEATTCIPTSNSPISSATG